MRAFVVVRKPWGQERCACDAASARAQWTEGATVLWPGLPASARVVIAGRAPPSSTWRLEAGWRDQLRVQPLGDLGPELAREFLEKSGVPAAQHDDVIRLTRGNPLALNLVTDA